MGEGRPDADMKLNRARVKRRRGREKRRISRENILAPVQGVITSRVQCTEWVTVWVAGLPKATLAPTPRLGCDPEDLKCTWFRNAHEVLCRAQLEELQIPGSVTH